MYVYMLAYVLPMSGADESCTERSLKYIQIKFKNLYIFFHYTFLTHPLHPDASSLLRSQATCCILQLSRTDQR